MKSLHTNTHQNTLNIIQNYKLMVFSNIFNAVKSIHSISFDIIFVNYYFGRQNIDILLLFTM